MEEKELINLPMDVKRAMDFLGLACKAALYGIDEDRFQKVFVKINEKIHQLKGRDFLLMSHQNQIIFISKLITSEFNQSVFKVDFEALKIRKDDSDSDLNF